MEIKKFLPFFSVQDMLSTRRTVFIKLHSVRHVSLIFCCNIVLSFTLSTNHC